MKKILSICFLVSVIYNTTAQQIFQKSYYVDTNAITQGASFVKLSNGDYLCVGLTGTYLNNDTYLLRTDSLGNIIWSKTLATQYQDRANNITATEDSNFIITGFHFNMPTGMSSGYAAPYLIKINENGNILWSKNFIDTGYYHEIWLKKTISLNNSYYSIGEIGVNVNYATGTIDTDTMKLGILIKTDATGNVLWAKQYGVYKTIFNDFTLSSDTNFMVVGYSEIFDSLSYNNKLLYLKVDTNGNPLWAKIWDAYFAIPKTVLFDSVQYLIGGTMSGGGGGDGFIFSVDLIGNVLSANRIGNGGTGYDEVISLVKLKNGNYAFPLGAIAIQVFNPVNNTVETHVNATNAFAYGKVYQLLPENDFGLSAVGHTGTKLLIDKCDSGFNNCTNFTFPFPITPLIINIDSSLIIANLVQINFILDTFNVSILNSLDSVYCSTSTFVNENETLSIKIYPNPCNDHLTLEMSKAIRSNYTISIKDLTGRVILSSTETEQQIIVDTHHLNSGIYLLSVKSMDESWTKKFIKL